jgi:hypothetical protein
MIALEEGNNVPEEVLVLLLMFWWLEVYVIQNHILTLDLLLVGPYQSLWH